MEPPSVTNIDYTVTISIVTSSEDDEDEDSTDTSTTETEVSTVSENEVRFDLYDVTLDGDGKIFYVMEKTHEYIEDVDDPGYYE